MAKVPAYCRFCGSRIEPDSRFCSYCGKQISLVTAASPTPLTPTTPTPAPAAVPTAPKAPTPQIPPTPTPTAPKAPTLPAPPPAAASRGFKVQKKTRSKKKIAVIVILVIVGIFGALIAIGASLNSTSSTFAGAGAPSDQEIETQIAQASPNPNIDTTWNEILNVCMNLHRLGDNLFESDCDGGTMIADRDNDCRTWTGELLMCDQNSSLGKKFQSYLNIIGYTTG